MRQNVRQTLAMVKTKALQGYVTGPWGGTADIDPTSDASVDAFINKYSKQNFVSSRTHFDVKLVPATTIFHPASTTPMYKASNPTGVLNPDLTVKNVANLRVVDLSVFVSLSSVTNIVILMRHDSHTFRMATQWDTSTRFPSALLISSRLLMRNIIYLD